MNKLIKYIRSAAAFLAAVVGLAACTGEPLAEPQPGSSDSILFNPDGTLGITLRMEFPGMSSALTRALDEKPGYENLSLYVLVFEQGEGLKQYLRPEPKEPNPDDDPEHGHKGLTTFNLSLEPTEKPVTIHLIATDQPDFDQQIGYGTEERVISSLYTDQEHEAYWQRRAFAFNIPSREQTDTNDAKYSTEAVEHAQAIREALSHVPMIRNFCRVSVENRAGNFILTGIFVVNTVDRGSAAPYVAADHRFVDYYNEPDPAGSHYTGKSYAEITAQGHIGSLPIGVQLINKVDGDIQTKSEAVVDRTNNTLTTPAKPVYFYERPARINSAERTYVILRGYRPGTDREDSFYKVDIGHIRGGDDPVGLFDYYNLLRNFDYHIRLHTVEERGYGTLQEAAKGAVFNNFSAAVEARNMTSISDGDDMIFVKFREPGSDEDIFSTTFVFTQPGEVIHLWSQYRIKLTTVTNGEVHNELIHAKFDRTEGDPGVIIRMEPIVEDADPDEDAVDDWNKYEITGGEPTDLLRQQSVYIYRGNKAEAGQPAEYGLYRVLTFFSHNPWPFVHIDTFSGLWEDVTQIPSWDPDVWSDSKREIGQFKDSPLTLFFELPPDLPQAIFPLDFVIESDRQNIQNAYKGNAVVRSVPASESLFYDPEATSNPTTTRIQYVKTVTWDEYYSGQSDEQVGTGSPIVRCRFLTITDLTQDGIGGSGSDGTSTTLLRVSNRYFGRLVGDKWQMYHEDGFVRSTHTSDPSPRSWDFNSAYWDDIMFEMNQNRTKKSDESQSEPDKFNVSADELTFKEGILTSSGPATSRTYTGSMSNAREKVLVDGIEEATGPRYVLLTHDNDALTHTHTYPQSTKRTIRLEVVSTDNNGNSTEPRIELDVQGGTMAAPTPTDTTQKTDDGKTIYIYEIDVPNNITGLTLNLKRPTGKEMRFYKIDFYPRWDEYGTN